jgi:thiol-disulfide isomerase/thioredoxin
VAVLVAAALLLLVVVMLQARARAAPVQVTVAGGTAVVGGPAPDFTSENLDGRPVRLSQFGGKPVLLNFWATWCAACQDEMPVIQRATDRYHASGLTVLAVNYRQTGVTAMRAFLARVDAKFGAVLDPAGQIAAEYRVTVGLPVSVFIDRAGRVQVIQLGQMSGPVLEQQLRTIL